MRERIDSMGGRLDVGPDAAGGWTVAATLPYATDVAVPTQRSAVISSSARRWTVRPVWLDLAFFLLWLPVLETEALTSSAITGSRGFNVAVVAVSAAAILLRRRRPLMCFAIMGACSLALGSGLDSGHHSSVNGVFGLVIPLYAVACWTTRRWAYAALVLWAVVAEVVTAMDGPSVAQAIGPLLAGAAAFAAGVVVQSQRNLLTSLRDTARLLADERRDRERLAIASERSRLTRALQLVVAEGVEAMVVQAQAAVTVLDGGLNHDIGRCASAMSAIETTGRDVLSQLRHILGVLRHRGASADVSPQPGVDRIHDLIDEVRTSGRRVELSVEGDPGTLVAGVDLATYRILEGALAVGPRSADAPIVVHVRFTATDVELRVTDPACAFANWSAPMLRQRVEMFRGAIDVSPAGAGGTAVAVCLPRVPEAAFA